MPKPDRRFLMPRLLSLGLGLAALPLTLHCGGGSSSAAAPAAVSVAVTPRTASLMAGGSQAFSAAVTGSSDTAVNWTVAEGAAGGTVSAGLYTAPAAGGIFHVTATSVADPGKSDTATVTVTAAAALTLTGAGTPFAPYQVLSFQVANATLGAGPFSGTIDGTVTVPVAQGAAGLMAFLVPVLPDGTHTFSLALGSQAPSLTFQSQQLTGVGAAADTISQGLGQWTQDVAGALAAASAVPGNDALVASLTALQTSLGQLPAQVAALSPGDQAALAQLLAANFGLGLGAAPADIRRIASTDIDVAACQAAYANLFPAGRQVLKDMEMMGLGAALFILTGGPTPIGLAGALAMVIAEARFLGRDFPAVTAAIGSYFDTCLPGAEDTESVDTNTGAMIRVVPRASARRRVGGVQAATAPTFAFKDKKPLDLIIFTSYSLMDPSLKALVADIDTLFAAIPASILSAGAAAELKPLVTSTVPAQALGSYFSLGAVSDPNITGVSGTAGKDLALSFTFTTPPASMTPVAFTFTITDSRDGHTDSLNGSLTPVVAETLTASELDTIPGGVVTLDALVDGLSDTDVTWSVSGGTIQGETATTLTWDAPSTAGTYTVTATSVADPLVSQSVTIDVGLPFAAGYIGNSSGGAAGYWQNGVWTGLAVPSGYTVASMDGIFTDGSSVYGVSSALPASNSNYVPLYWKDGTPTFLSSPLAGGTANAIFVSGGDIYVSGTATGSLPVSGPPSFEQGYWLNGAWVGLPLPGQATSSWVDNIQVVGTDVYVCGTYSYLDASSNVFQVPGYWLNGVWNQLAMPTGANEGAQANNVIVADGNVYVGGTGVVQDPTSPSSSSASLPGYWLNGAWNALPVEGGTGGWVNDMTVAGGHVYCGGGMYVPSGNTAILLGTPCYWVDGVQTLLPLPPGNQGGAYVESILVVGTDVFTGGWYYLQDPVSGNTNNFPALWQNGTLVSPPLPAGATFGGINALAP